MCGNCIRRVKICDCLQFRKFCCDCCYCNKCCKCEFLIEDDDLKLMSIEDEKFEIDRNSDPETRRCPFGGVMRSLEKWYATHHRSPNGYRIHKSEPIFELRLMELLLGDMMCAVHCRSRDRTLPDAPGGPC
jgi:hypothetical protein